jgi:hypothetical protein
MMNTRLCLGLSLLAWSCASLADPVTIDFSDTPNSGGYPVHSWTVDGVTIQHDGGAVTSEGLELSADRVRIYDASRTNHLVVRNLEYSMNDVAFVLSALDSNFDFRDSEFVLQTDKYISHIEEVLPVFEYGINMNSLPGGTVVLKSITVELGDFPIVQHVKIDVKPGSEENCFNQNGHGLIPVAILGNPAFDVSYIALETLGFGGLEVRVRGNNSPMCSLSDVNDDGMWDLVCQFADDPDLWSPGDGEARLSGELADGTRFEGTDSICVLP